MEDGPTSGLISSCVYRLTLPVCFYAIEIGIILLGGNSCLVQIDLCMLTLYQMIFSIILERKACSSNVSMKNQDWNFRPRENKKKWMASSKVERLREFLYFDVAQCTLHIVGYYHSGVKTLYALILAHGVWTRVTSSLLIFIGAL